MANQLVTIAYHTYHRLVLSSVSFLDMDVQCGTEHRGPFYSLTIAIITYTVLRATYC